MSRWTLRDLGSHRLVSRRSRCDAFCPKEVRLSPHRISLVGEIVKDIEPLLAEHSLAVQGEVIAELVALWLINYPVKDREYLIKRHLEYVRELEAFHDEAHAEHRRKHSH